MSKIVGSMQMMKLSVIKLESCWDIFHGLLCVIKFHDSNEEELICI